MKFASHQPDSELYQPQEDFIASENLLQQIFNRIESLKRAAKKIKEELRDISREISSESPISLASANTQKKITGLNIRVVELEEEQRQTEEALGPLLELREIIKESADPVKALLEKGLAISRLSRVQREALEHVETKGKEKNFNFNKAEILFISSDFPILRLRSFDGLFLHIPSGAKKERFIIFISDRLKTLASIAHALVHETFHKRFYKGEAVLLERKPELFWLYRVLNEGLTEYLTQKKLKDMGHKLSYRHKVAYAQKVIFLERFFKNYGLKGEKAIVTFLKTGKTDSLETILGHNAWQKIIQISRIPARHPLNTPLSNLCEGVLETWMRQNGRDAVLDIGLSLIKEFTQIKRIAGISISAADLDKIKSYAAEYLLGHLGIIEAQPAIYKKQVLRGIINFAIAKSREGDIDIKRLIKDNNLWDMFPRDLFNTYLAHRSSI